MEDREVSDYQDHSEQLGTLPKYARYADYAKYAECAKYSQCDAALMLSAIRTSTLPGGEHPNTDPASLDRRLLQPPALGQDWALTPTFRCLPSADDIATDYGLFVYKLPVTIAMSGLGGDITGNTEDDLRPCLQCAPFLSAASTSCLAPGDCTLDSPSCHYTQGSGGGN
jgi:hypothetical protein